MVSTRVSIAIGILGFSLVAIGTYIGVAKPTLGKQADGSYLVSTGQRIEAGSLAFRGRPSDMALSPDGKRIAVLSKNEVFLIENGEVVKGSNQKLGADAGFHGVVWLPKGDEFIVTTADGYLQAYRVDGDTVTPSRKIVLGPEDKNPVPGGMAITKDGATLYVPLANQNEVVKVDLATATIMARYPVETLPFDVKLSQDETQLIVSNWGGRLPKATDLTSPSAGMPIVVDKRGAPSSGTVSLVDLGTKVVKSFAVGIHPTSVAVAGNLAYVANAMSDTVSEIDLEVGQVSRTIELRWKKLRIIGAMPVALAVKGDRLYVCDGGDNAVAEIDRTSGKVIGYRSAGYYPIQMLLHGTSALVLNSKGNGSVANTAYGRVGNAHDFEGTLTTVDLSKDLMSETAKVVANNRWDRPLSKPKLAVYNGAIKHVLYIIKENRTYDEIFGDFPQGNGDPKLCSLGEKVMPNHRALARQFTLFDNGYVTGTNSADGHAWSTQSLANDYLEHFYVGYSRTYPDDGDCAMSISTGGCLWDTVLKKKLTFRDYGEFCDDALAEYSPYRPKDWFEAWEDRKNGSKKFKFTAHTRVEGLKPYIHPTVHYWPLIQSDQSRADEFIADFEARLKKGTVPNLMMLSLCCDHSEGTDPNYPAPAAMMADNDLALGRVVEAISKSPIWKNTAIFVIEDDAQSGPDHVDGHRTPYFVISPYNRMKSVDSNIYTTTHMVRSIEMMLGAEPMNRFDLLAGPITTCFTDTPDLTPFKAVPNNVPLDMPNPGRKTAMTRADRYWAEKTRSLDWSHPDGPDEYWLNRIIWHSTHPDGTPYPARPGEAPNSEVDRD